MSKVGKNIARIRKKIGMTQEELSKRMGYKSISAIAKIETGVNDISQSNVVRFAEILGTTPSVIMGWEEEKSSQTIEVSEDEASLIELFRLVPEEKKQMCLAMIRAALSR